MEALKIKRIFLLKMLCNSKITPTFAPSIRETVTDSKPENFICYRWVDEEDENAYFEFIIHTIELTGSTALEITDFSEPGEKKDSINLWDSQVEDLKRTLGI